MSKEAQTTAAQSATKQPAQADDEVEFDLRSALFVATKALDLWKEPTNALVTIRDFLLDAAQKDRVSKDAVFAKFLYEQCAPGLTKKLAKERSNDNNVSNNLFQLN